MLFSNPSFSLILLFGFNCFFGNYQVCQSRSLLGENAIKTINSSNPAVQQPCRHALPLTAWRLAFGFCVLTVLVLALMPTDVPIPSTGWDKSNHLLAFSVMALLGMRAFRGRTMAVLAGLLIYGVLIEVLQSFTPSRSADWHDVLADAVGLVLGWGAWQLARLVTRLRAG